MVQMKSQACFILDNLCHKYQIAGEETGMATMNISVTDKMRAWVETRVADGDYATASDCLRDLIRGRMEREQKLAALRVEIQKGIDSGPSDRSWQEVIAEARALIARRASVG